MDFVGEEGCGVRDRLAWSLAFMDVRKFGRIVSVCVFRRVRVEDSLSSLVLQSVCIMDF